MADEMLELPLEIIKASAGFSFDIGGSLAKIVYRSKKDFRGGEPTDKDKLASGQGKLRLKILRSEQLDDIIEFIKEECDITTDSHGKCVVYSTGLGGNQQKTEVEQKLNVKLVNKSEFDCFVAALCLLLKIKSQEEMFKPLHKLGWEEGKKMSKLISGFKEVAAAGGKGRFIDESDLPDGFVSLSEEGTHFPFLLAMCGSGFGWLKVEEDGTYAVAGGSPLGGRFFLGVTSFLTGIRDFDEISRLIEESSGETVDTFMDDLLDPKANDDSYAAMRSEFRIFPLGKGLSDARYKATKGDMIHSVLESICENTAQLTMSTSGSLKIPRVYFAGNFANTPKVQQFMTRSISIAQELGFINADNIKFLKNGGHLGAVGAFLESFNAQKK